HKQLMARERKALESVKIVAKYFDWLKRTFVNVKVAHVEFRCPLDDVGAERGALTSFMDSFSKLPTKVGYVRRLDYSASKGYYIRLLALFAEDVTRDEVTLTELVGYLWRDKATRGKG